MSNSFFSAIAHQIQQQGELEEAAEEVTTVIFPIIDELKRRDIINPIMLKVKLAKLTPEYRDAVYGLCRIATEGGPEGSFIVLDPEKVLSLLDEIEVEEEAAKKKKSKKSILGITKKVVKAIKVLAVAKLSILCHLVNKLVIEKIINVPSPDKLKVSSYQISSLSNQQNKDHSR